MSLTGLVNIPHLHLLLNHFPVIGTVVAFGLFLLSLIRRNDHLTRVSYEALFVIALLTLPVYMSGTAAQAALQGQAGVSEPAMTAHQDAALLAFTIMEITGAIAWLGLWQFRRMARPASWISPAVLLLTTVTIVLMASAANVGGEIRHPEVVPDGTIGSPIFITTRSIKTWVDSNRWVWPASETVHFVGLSLLVGILSVVNLRLIGAIKGVPFAALHRLLPWAILGFAMNLTTGMLFFIAASQQYVANEPFYWKMVFLGLAGVNLLYLTVFDKTWRLKPGEDPRVLDRAIAASTLGLWAAVIYCGRMLPFLGNAF
jgi:uncharacterized membrane protein